MSSRLKEGTVFAGRYRIVRGIASGGMGSVYEVMHLETERRRALKVMHPHILQNAEMRERFKREAKVAANIESDFIVDVFDAGIEEATQMPFLVMELLRGEELGKRLKRLGRLPPDEVVLHLYQTALALDKTHKASIVHRDLKPENLFLAHREDSPPRIKVLDFGIAKIVAEGASTGSTTQSIGTPLYMSPEQFNPDAKISGASDIYALGMIAYTLLVGSSYWSAEARAGNIFAVAAVAIHGPPDPASARAEAKGVSLSPAFDAWFAMATAAKPADRFATATAAVRALAEALAVVPPMGESSLSARASFLDLSGAADRARERLPPAPAPDPPGQGPSRWLDYPPPSSARRMSAEPAAAYRPPSASGALHHVGSQPKIPGAPPSQRAGSLPALMPEAPPTGSPGMTSLGTSVTGPLRKERTKRGLVTLVLAAGAMSIGGVLAYASRANHRAPAQPAENPTEIATQALPYPSTLATTTERAVATSALLPSASASSTPRAPDQKSAPEGSKAPSKSESSKPVPSAAAKAAPPPPPRPPANTPLRRKYTQE